MRMPSTLKAAVRPVVGTVKLRVGHSFARTPKGRVRAGAYHLELPRKLWDRIVLLMFTGCLFTFFHAFFGFGAVDEDSSALNNTSWANIPRATLSISSLWSRELGASNGGREMRACGVTRVIVDWHGNYELLPGTMSASVLPASIPQDAFPGPTPALVQVGARRRRGPDEGSISMTKAEASPDTPFAFYGTPYDPFRLEFEDSIDAGDVGGLYPIAGPSRTTVHPAARTLRFGRCLPRGACL